MLAHELDRASEPSPVPSPDAIRAQLERMLHSSDFAASQRNREFLRYVVEETLLGRADHIKGYSIALSVFKRDPSFDPQLDPVVRIEAARLRRAIEWYYLTAGRADLIRVDLPKGGYVPTFSFRADPTGQSTLPTAPAAPDRIWSRLAGWRERRWMVGTAAMLLLGVAAVLWLVRSEPVSGSPPALPALPAGRDAVTQSVPGLAVLPLENLSADAGQSYIARGITDELIGALSQFAGVRVVAVSTQLVATTSDPMRLGQALAVGYVLTGSVRPIGERVRIAVRLLDAKDGTYVWAGSFDRAMQPQSIVVTETEIAATIGASLGAPEGAIAQLTAHQLARGVPDNLLAYECTLRSYGYRRNPSQALHDQVRDCLERAIKVAPDYAESWAQLAYIYLNEFVFGFSGGYGHTDLRDHAFVLAQRAVELNRRSAIAHMALATAYYYRHELAAADAEGLRALTLNPNDPEVVMQVGWHLAVPGHWDEGMRLFHHGLDLEPDPPRWVYEILALDAYRRGDREGALAQIQRGALIPIDAAYLICTGILADYGQTAEARVAFEAGQKLNPYMFNDPRARLAVYNVDPMLIERLAAALDRFAITLRHPAGTADAPP